LLQPELAERDLILSARGVVVSYETVRECGLRCGRTYANSIKRREPILGDSAGDPHFGSAYSRLMSFTAAEGLTS
jgi:hypothetical protein